MFIDVGSRISWDGAIDRLAGAASKILPSSNLLHKAVNFMIFMSLVSHKKSYLVCVELTNFRIFTQPIPIFFSKYKTETANRGQRQLLFLTSGFHPNSNNTQLADDMLEILIVNGFD